MSGRPWLKALKATITERTAATNETPKKTSEALRSVRCESPADVPPPVADILTADKVRGSWGEEERNLIGAGWEPKERGGLVIWANPDTGFYCSQEVALHRLEAGQGAGFGTFTVQKSAGVMGSGEGVADDRDGKP